MIELTKTIWEKIWKINSDVNKSTKYKPDMTLYEKLDYWDPVSLHNNMGDCEDYALEKRLRLLNEGFDVEDVRLATCWVEGDDGTPGEGGYHAVLIVSTTGGDYCLDNRYTSPILWGDLPYKWDRILIKNGQWRQIKE